MGYLKVALPSSQGYIFKANWSDEISVPECNIGLDNREQDK
jgi:hypothetical protein